LVINKKKEEVMLKMSYLLAGVGLLCVSVASQAESVLDHYRSPGMTFSAQRGETFWKHEVPGRDGKLHSCTTCHGSDLTKSGKHIRTGRPIKPMAHSVNPERFTDPAKVEKWFTRNCKWTIGRVCTPQEKGDILTYLLSL
jgi:hypothetical protein